MYTPTNTRISDARVERLLQLATCVDISAGPGGSRMSDPAETEKVFAPDIEDLFPSPRTYVTVVALYPSMDIPAHRDAAIVGKRYHLPLATNSLCWVFSDGDWQQLNVGWIYRMDPTEWHGAVNWGATRRLHLLVDCA